MGETFEVDAPASHSVHLPIVPQPFLSMQDAQNLQVTIGWASGKWKVFVKYMQEREHCVFLCILCKDTNLHTHATGVVPLNYRIE